MARLSSKRCPACDSPKGHKGDCPRVSGPPVQVRCEPCLGMGYKGRWRQTARGRAWKLEACRACGGTGQRAATDRQRGRR